MMDVRALIVVPTTTPSGKLGPNQHLLRITLRYAQGCLGLSQVRDVVVAVREDETCFTPGSV